MAVGSSSSRRCTNNLKQLHGSSPLQYVHSKADEHHVTATNGLEYLCSCPLSHVTVDGSCLSRSFRRFHLRIWPGAHGIICPSIDKANCCCHRVQLSCTIYCFCSIGVVCRNSFINKYDEAGDEEQHNYDHGHDMITISRMRKKMTSWMIAI